MPRAPLSPAPLPVDAALPALLAALEGRGAALVKAPTGSGKTTRIPPALAATLPAGKRVVVLEPRRVAARAAARRVAEERGWRLGEEVGYRVRFDDRTSARSRVVFVTEGVLVAMLQADPFLEEAGAVVFDELHERSLDADLALAMTRRLRREARPELRLVAMSATLEVAAVAAFLGDERGPAPLVESEGRLHPVEIRHLPRPDPRPLPAAVAAGVRELAALIPEGDLLAFLPGSGEIRRAGELLAPWAEAAGVELVPLFGDLPPEAQDRALRRGERRRVVLATNVAESSVTVEGVRAVVDSGRVRRLRFDPGSGLDGLELGRVSRASADQRAGRAGREGPGVCLRLWTAMDERALAAHETPEVRRVDLAGAALQLLAWGEVDLARFDWLEAPEPASLETALALLEVLGATAGGRLTALGRSMASLPAHPRLARLLALGAERGALRRAALAAAILAERGLVSREAAAEAAYPAASDLLDRVEAVERFARLSSAETALGPLRRERAREVLRAAEQLETATRRALGREEVRRGGGEADGEEVLRLALAAYPDRVARRREPGSPRAVLLGGRGVRLAPSSVVREAELFVALELDAGKGRDPGGEARVWTASAVDPGWLETTAVDEVVFDPGRERVVGRRRTLYRDLAVAEVEVPPAAGGGAGRPPAAPRPAPARARARAGPPPGARRGRRRAAGTGPRARLPRARRPPLPPPLAGGGLSRARPADLRGRSLERPPPHPRRRPAELR